LDGVEEVEVVQADKEYPDQRTVVQVQRQPHAFILMDPHMYLVQQKR
jgi:hypothetical protein